VSLFKITGEELSLIKEKPFKLEKDLQKITECNLTEVLGLKFVRSEFELNKFRIDTLAFDEKTGAFVIIEYKRDKNFSVIDQGYAYLALMLNNKADFILEYNEKLGQSLKRDSVDWSQSRVVFIAPSFTKFQQESINFKDLPIELWEIKRYSNDTVNYAKIQSGTATESIKTVSKQDKAIEKVSKEIKVYTEEDHLSGKPDEAIELYSRLKERVLGFDNVEIKPTKVYIGFINKTNFVDVLVQKSGLKIWLNLHFKELDDPKKLARDVHNVGHWGNGECEILIKNDENLDYIMSLIKQSYKKNSE